MYQVVDNVRRTMGEALQQALPQAQRADFCIGYITLGGWREIQPMLTNWPAGRGPCRVLVGMDRPEDRQQLQKLLQEGHTPAAQDAVAKSLL